MNYDYDPITLRVRDIFHKFTSKGKIGIGRSETIGNKKPLLYFYCGSL